VLLTSRGQAADQGRTNGAQEVAIRHTIRVKRPEQMKMEIALLNQFAFMEFVEANPDRVKPDFQGSRIQYAA